MTAERSWTFDRHPSYDGPWTGEPDKVQWIDEATDLDCLAVRNRLDAWCGYVGVPPGHQLHGLDYEAVHERLPDLDVHGGLTFAAGCHERENGDGVCHVPAAGRPADLWWIGFDCAHIGDVVPGMDAVRPDGLPPLPSRGHYTYKDLGFIRTEVTRLAEQLAPV